MQSHYRRNPIPIPSTMDHPINSPQLSHVDSGEVKFKLSDIDEYLNNLPPGYRFRPSEQEIIVEYLLKKINNEALPPNRIHTIRLSDYSPENLAKIFKASGENEYYFFTPTERKYKNGWRPDRAAGDGYWKATGADRAIKHNGEVIGIQKALAFYRGKSPHGTKTHWLMHEFRVKNARTKSQKLQENSMRLDDWVLCKVYLRNSSNRRTNKEANDNAARSLHPCVEGHDPLYVESKEFPQLLVESSQYLISGSSSSSSDGAALLSFPYDHQQGHGFASESANGRRTFPSYFQGHDHPPSVECQELSRLRVESSSYPISSRSFSSNSFGLSSFPYHHLQGPPFASESANERTVYPSHFQV